MNQETVKLTDDIFYQIYKFDSNIVNQETGEKRKLTLKAQDSIYRSEWLLIYNKIDNDSKKNFSDSDISNSISSCPLETKILLDYQVNEADSIEWSAYGLGFYKHSLTNEEILLLDGLNFDDKLRFLWIYNEAPEHANSAYPVPENWDGSIAEWMNFGHNDAFRHAYWNARLTQAFGVEFTKSFTTAHETIKSNEFQREAQDLYNNEIGRKIGEDHPEASENEIHDLVLEALNKGELVIVDKNGFLLKSDCVNLGEHYVKK